MNPRLYSEVSALKNPKVKNFYQYSTTFFYQNVHWIEERMCPGKVSSDAQELQEGYCWSGKGVEGYGASLGPKRFTESLTRLAVVVDVNRREKEEGGSSILETITEPLTQGNFPLTSSSSGESKKGHGYCRHSRQGKRMAGATGETLTKGNSIWQPTETTNTLLRVTYMGKRLDIEAESPHSFLYTKYYVATGHRKNQLSDPSRKEKRTEGNFWHA